MTAQFTPADATAQASSTSDPLAFTVARVATSTTVSVPGPTVPAGASVTYTARVAPGRCGPLTPAGGIEFFDARRPIASCADKALSADGAACTIRHPATGSHGITAA